MLDSSKSKNNKFLDIFYVLSGGKMLVMSLVMIYFKDNIGVMQLIQERLDYNLLWFLLAIMMFVVSVMYWSTPIIKYLERRYIRFAR